MLRLSRIALIFLLLLLLSCSAALDRPRERYEYWTKRVETELPIGSSKEIVLNWIKNNKIELNKIRDHQRVTAQIERIAGDGLVCSHWIVSLRLVFNTKAELVERKVESAGVCL